MRFALTLACALFALGACSEASPVARTAVAPTPPRASAVAVPAAPCPVTRAVPPEDVPAAAARPIVNGSSRPDLARANLSMAGTDAFWATVPRGAASLSDRFFVLRLVPGRVFATARRLDGPAPPATVHIPEGYGPDGLQVVGFTFPTPGCWELTYRLEGATVHESRVTLLVAAAP